MEHTIRVFQQREATPLARRIRVHNVQSLQAGREHADIHGVHHAVIMEFLYDAAARVNGANPQWVGA
ncbi:hypothetical protein GCM10009861_17970 [Neomicrococcus aestuarii]